MFDGLSSCAATDQSNIHLLFSVQLPFRNEEAAKIDLFFRATNSRVPFNSSHEGGHKGISLK